MAEPIFINADGDSWVGIVDPHRPLSVAEARKLLEQEGFDVVEGSVQQEGFLQTEMPPEHAGEFSSWWERVPLTHPNAVAGVVCDRL